jgi:16S rRNA (guanine1207-N2)-methyltransferase
MPADRGDPALDVLFSPFESGALAWPVQGDVLFLRARHGEALQRVAAATADRLHCEQSFAPDADALRRAGWTLRDAVFPETPVADAALDTAPDAIELGRDALVLALPPRQREEARALLARAVLACAPGGTVVACMANDEGAKSGESDLRALAGLDGQASKQHCRVYWSKPSPQRTDTALLAAWRVLDAPRPVADGRFLSRPGVFAWDRIDAASALLAAHLPTDLRGRAADLGAGYGYLSVELLERCPGIVALDLYEAQARALRLAQRNLQPFAARCALRFLWCDVTAGLRPGYDVVVCNPPFHAQGRADRPDIGRAFIAAAADALNAEGRLWLVANRHLPYEQSLAARFRQVRTVAQAEGFKVIEAIAPRAVRDRI